MALSNPREQRLHQGDDGVFAELFDAHRPRLWRFLHFRMNERVRSRIDPDDVVQEVYLAAASRLHSFRTGDYPSLFVWLRLVAAQTLSNAHRTHLGTLARSVLREQETAPVDLFSDPSVSLSTYFVDRLATPSQHVSREELAGKLHEIIQQMKPLEREILAMRHFEELTNQEVAAVLGIDPRTASMRYVRALERLRQTVAHLPGLQP